MALLFDTKRPIVAADSLNLTVGVAPKKPDNSFRKMEHRLIVKDKILLSKAEKAISGITKTNGTIKGQIGNLDVRIYLSLYDYFQQTYGDDVIEHLNEMFLQAAELLDGTELNPVVPVDLFIQVIQPTELSDTLQEWYQKNSELIVGATNSDGKFIKLDNPESYDCSYGFAWCSYFYGHATYVQGLTKFQNKPFEVERSFIGVDMSMEACNSYLFVNQVPYPGESGLYTLMDRDLYFSNFNFLKGIITFNSRIREVNTRELFKLEENKTPRKITLKLVSGEDIETIKPVLGEIELDEEVEREDIEKDEGEEIEEGEEPEEREEIEEIEEGEEGEKSESEEPEEF